MQRQKLNWEMLRRSFWFSRIAWTLHIVGTYNLTFLQEYFGGSFQQIIWQVMSNFTFISCNWHCSDSKRASVASVLVRFAFWGTLLILNDLFPSNLYELVLGVEEVEVVGVALWVELEVLGVLSTTSSVHGLSSSSSDRSAVSAVSAASPLMSFNYKSNYTVRIRLRITK